MLRCNRVTLPRLGLPVGVNGRGDGLQKSGHILYTRGCPGWKPNPKKQRQHFYRDYASGQWSMSELCGRYQISRPTGYKWVDRIEVEA